MSEDLQIKATIREEVKKGIKNLREKDLIPAQVYGRGKENKNIKIDEKAFKEVYLKAGESTLIDLIIDEQEPVKVLLKEVQRDPVKEDILHVDFYIVNMEEELTAEIELVFVGQSPAEKELGGVRVSNKDKLQIKCLPADLIKEIKVDISPLKTFEDSIKIKDLDIPEKIEVLDNLDDIVVLVTPPRTDEELKALEESPEEEVGEVAVVGEKKEGEEGEEGEAESAEGEAKEAKPEEKKEEKK
ncbi:MAG: 50S ribosomal protein L25 [Patescibacteria group bacterium]